MGFFHRYNSTIHGNYRRAYLRCDLLTGVLLAFYIIARLLAGTPAESPISYISDAILLVLVILLTAYYRNSLPEKKITLKEAMLFGIGTSVLAALVYGLAIVVIGLVAPEQTVLFTASLSGQTITPQDPQLHYWAAMWGFVTFVDVALLGAFGSFLAAIFLRNEKSEIKHNQK